MAEFHCKEVIGGVPVYYCYLEYKGTRYYAEEYSPIIEVAKGDSVTAAFNVSGSGRVAVQIWDWKNWEEIKWIEFDAPASKTHTFTVDKDREIGFVLYEKQPDGTWKQVDTYGNWIIKVKEEVCPIASIGKPSLELKPGGVLRVDAIVYGTPYKSDTVTLYIDDKVVDSTTVYIYGDGKGSVSFEVDVTTYSVGEHTVKLCACDGKVCSPTATFEIKPVEIQPKITIDVKTDVTYYIYEPVAIPYTASNLTGKKIVLIVDGKKVDERTIKSAVDSGVFYYAFKSYGLHEIKVCTSDGSVCSNVAKVVVSRDPATKLITLNEVERWITVVDLLSRNVLPDTSIVLEYLALAGWELPTEDWLNGFYSWLEDRLEDFCEGFVKPVTRIFYEKFGLDAVLRRLLDYLINEAKKAGYDYERFRSEAIEMVKAVEPEVNLPSVEFITIESLIAPTAAAAARKIITPIVAVSTIIGSQYVITWYCMDNLQFIYTSRVRQNIENNQWVLAWDAIKDLYGYVWGAQVAIVAAAVASAILSETIAIRILGKDTVVAAKKAARIAAFSLSAFIAAWGVSGVRSMLIYADSARVLVSAKLGIKPWSDLPPPTSYAKHLLENPTAPYPTSENAGFLHITTDPPYAWIAVWNDTAKRWELASAYVTPTEIALPEGTYRLKFHTVDFRGYIYEYEGVYTVKAGERVNVNVKLIRQEEYIPPGEHECYLIKIDDDDPLVFVVDYNGKTAKVRLAGLESTRKWLDTGFTCDVGGVVDIKWDQWVEEGKEFLQILIGLARRLIEPGTKITVKVDGSVYIPQRGETLPLAVVYMNSTDVNELFLENGIACYNSQYNNKYVDPAKYIAASNRAISIGAGMWKYVTVSKKKITIESTPSSKVYIDRTITTAMETEVTLGQHEIIFVADGYYALKVIVNVKADGIECISAEYGEFNEVTKTFTKKGSASCNACTTRENGVCITDFTIHGYLKKKEEVVTPPPTEITSFEDWVRSKGGCVAIKYTDILELVRGYMGTIDLGFTVTFTNVITAVRCYMGTITSLSSRLAKELEQISSKSLISKILEDLEKKGG